VVPIVPSTSDKSIEPVYATGLFKSQESTPGPDLREVISKLSVWEAYSGHLPEVFSAATFEKP
jgi:hypothetical protein